MKNVINNIVSSKKFWYGFAIIMIVLFADKMGIDAVKVNTLTQIGCVMILAQGIADILKK